LLHCYPVVRLLSNCCCTVVRLTSHCCCTVVTLLLNYTVVTLASHCGYTVAKLLLRSHTVATLLCQYFTAVPLLCYMVIDCCHCSCSHIVTLSSDCCQTQLSSHYCNKFVIRDVKGLSNYNLVTMISHCCRSVVTQRWRYTVAAQLSNLKNLDASDLSWIWRIWIPQIWAESEKSGFLRSDLNLRYRDFIWIPQIWAESEKSGFLRSDLNLRYGDFIWIPQIWAESEESEFLRSELNLKNLDSSDLIWIWTLGIPEIWLVALLPHFC
jgi:hypothetical protein